MSKPIIGIVSRKEITDDANYITSVEGTRKAIVQAGGIPFLIISTQGIEYKDESPSNVRHYTDEEINDLDTILDMCDAIVMPGGTTWYEMDELIVKYAIVKDKPLLGICLGMQILGKVLLRQDGNVLDPTIKNDTYICHQQPGVDQVHPVNIKKCSKLYQIIGQDNIMVNSRHNYHIPEVLDSFVSAVAPDGIIEAIEIPDKKFILGVQWHPELTFTKDDASYKILTKFINISK